MATNGTSTPAPQSAICNTQEKQMDTDIGEDPSGQKALIAARVNATCEENGGLKMHVSTRGGKPVNEDLVFGPGSLQRLELRSDFTLVMTFNGANYWVQDRRRNLALVQGLLADGAVRFPPELSFSGTALPIAQTELAPAK